MINKTLFIRNLNFRMQTKDLTDLFEQLGASVKIKHFNQRGYAFVELESRERAEQAFREINGQILMGRKIQIDWARSPSGKKPPKRQRKFHSKRSALQNAETSLM